jgi:protein-tyrosine phosphatase
MAQALLLKKWQEISETAQPGPIQVRSAGLFTPNDLPASPQAIKVMQEQGIDLSLHRSAKLQASHIKAADLILTMTVNQRDNIAARFPDKRASIYTLGEFTGDAGREILDPYGQGLDAYRKSLSQLQLMIDRLVDKIIELDLGCED